MKRIISGIIFTLLAVVLVACGGTTKQGSVKASVPSVTVKSISIEARVTITDVDKELEEGSVVVKLKSPTGVEHTVEGLSTVNNKKILFEDLVASTKYEFTITGIVNGIEKRLFRTSYETAAIGVFEENPILISTVEEFLDMRGTNQEGKHRLFYKQTADLDFEDASLQSIFSSGRSFSGGYDGDGFKIMNLSISERADVNRAYPSIFGYVSSAKIKNIVLDNVSFDNTVAENAVYTGSLYASLLVSKISTNNAIIENITVLNSSINLKHNLSGSTNRNTYVGLVLGSGQGTIKNITIENSYVNVETAGSNRSVSATEGTFIGGAIGLIELERAKEISNIFVSADVSVDASQHRANTARGNIYLGGVIGSHRGYTDIDGIYYNGDLSFVYETHEDSEYLDIFMIGGLIGQVKSGSLYNAYVNGTVTVDFGSEVQEAYVGATVGVSDFSGNKIIANNKLEVVGVTELPLVVSLYNFSRPQDWSPDAFLRTEVALVELNGLPLDITNIQTITNEDILLYFTNEDLISYLS